MSGEGGPLEAKQGLGGSVTLGFRRKLGLGTDIAASVVCRIEPARNILVREWEAGAATSAFERKQDGWPAWG